MCVTTWGNRLATQGTILSQQILIGRELSRDRMVAQGSLRVLQPYSAQIASSNRNPFSMLIPKFPRDFHRPPGTLRERAVSTEPQTRTNQTTITALQQTLNNKIN